MHRCIRLDQRFRRAEVPHARKDDVLQLPLLLLPLSLLLFLVIFTIGLSLSLSGRVVVVQKRLGRAEERDLAQKAGEAAFLALPIDFYTETQEDCCDRLLSAALHNSWRKNAHTEATCRDWASSRAAPSEWI